MVPATSRESVSSQVDQHHFGSVPGALQHRLMTVRRHIEVAGIEIRGQIGELLLGAGLQMDEPQILVLNLSSRI